MKRKQETPSVMCPVMSCRLIGDNNQPVIIKCQTDCGWYDCEHKCCGVVGIKMEMVK